VGPADDDLNYTVVALRILKSHGREFTPDDVLATWARCLPFGAVCTAEKMAYRNYVMGLRYPETARTANEYCEWIGAQIRADLYGYVSPGQPAEAARMAFSDAAASHVANGIYGAMWVAAALAVAFHEDDPETIVLRALEQVPRGSRFAEHMRATVDAARAHGEDFEQTFEDIERRLGHYHCVHTVNNACVVAAALMHGGHDFGKVITIAVMGGLDTDCNGATAGSIAGAMLGRERLPGRWVDVFNDTLHSSVSGYQRVAVTELVEETAGLVAGE
jgi:ADP-ribosylglycohydrolase